MEKQYKTYLLKLGVSGFLILLAGMGVNYYLGPFQIYHPSRFVEDRYIDNPRYQNAGLIRIFWEAKDCCDTVVIGTSMSQNFSPAQVTRTLESKGTLNLALPGGNAAEQEALLSFLFSLKAPKTIIYDMHTSYSEPWLDIVNEPSLMKNSPGKFLPLYLYDKKVWNDFKYLASLDHVGNVYKLLRTGRAVEDIQSWYVPEHGKDHSQEILGAARSVSFKEIDNEAHLFPKIDEIILPLVRDNPGTDFAFYIPPYPRLSYASMNSEQYSKLMAMRRHLAGVTSKYPNMKVYVFDTFFPEIDDLIHYKDLGHYKPYVNNKIVEYIAEGRGAITPATVEKNIADTTALVNKAVKFYHEKGIPLEQ